MDDDAGNDSNDFITNNQTMMKMLTSFLDLIIDLLTNISDLTKKNMDEITNDIIIQY